MIAHTYWRLVDGGPWQEIPFNDYQAMSAKFSLPLSRKEAQVIIDRWNAYSSNVKFSLDPPCSKTR